jgi:hypothetical protein
VTGYLDSTGQNFDRFGSDDAQVEGFFDLAGLQIPNGATSAQYQLSVEAVDPLWSTNAGPYGSSGQVQPSGSAQPILITVTRGSDVSRDILMQVSAAQKQQWHGSTTYDAPLPLPKSGNWSGASQNYGTTDYFQFSARANRTLSVIVNALDESTRVSEGKMLPVAGMWSLANPGQSPAPANTSSAFNTAYFGETRLDAQILQSTTFRLGIADYRGDGRPDYVYEARVLYGDSILPARASVAGNTPITIEGLGLQSHTDVQIPNISLPVLASSATRLLVATPVLTDGTYDVLLNDTNTGGSSTMTGILIVGADATDSIKLISGTNPATPVGGQAPGPFTVQVVESDGVTPVAGASVQFTSSPLVAFSACSGSTNCTVLTDQSGIGSTYMTVLSAGAMTLTAKLAPATYPNPKQLQATLLGISTQLDLSLATPSVWIAQGAPFSLPISARVLSSGTPVSGRMLNYQITHGNATLGAASAQTDANGNASVSLQSSSKATAVQVSVCVAPNNNPCQIFNATVVPVASLQLQGVAGTLQIAPPGQTFQPVVVRVTDSATPPHSVLGASVVLLSYIGRMPQNQPIVWAGEAGISQPEMPVILAKSQTTVQSDINGTATVPIAAQGISGNIAIVGSATAGSNSVEFVAQQLGP